MKLLIDESGSTYTLRAARKPGFTHVAVMHVVDSYVCSFDAVVDEERFTIALTVDGQTTECKIRLAYN